MNLTAEHTYAENGTPVNSVVRLDIDDVGHVDRPFEVFVTVGHNRLYTSFHKTRDDADKAREEMHAAYMEVHATAELP